ncbi:MAG TPA: PAS domain S-box protein [Caulobacteraceae bacterium]
MQNQALVLSPPEAGASLRDLPLHGFGTLNLDCIRETALRVGRVAEALFGAIEADVVALHEGRVWRGKATSGSLDDEVARALATTPEALLWIADTHLYPPYRDHPMVTRPLGIRFCAAAPIRLRAGVQIGSLRVFDVAPRAYDPMLAGALQDLAELVANDCERFLHLEVQRVRELFNEAPGFMALSRGRDHVLELVNAAFHDFVGERDYEGKPVRLALPETVEQGFVDIIDHVYRTGEAYVARGQRVMVNRVAGEPPVEAYADFVYQPLREPDGTITGVFCQGHDVTREVKVAEEARRNGEQLQAALAALQAVFDHSHDVICTLDSAGHYTAVSSRAETVWGYKPEEMIGRSYLDFVHPDDFERSSTCGMEITGGAGMTTFYNRVVRKDGDPVPMMWSSAWSSDYTTIVSIARDMTEHMAAEERLRQAQKMEAVGRLTGGVAHDFNNLLTAVIGAAEALSESLPGDGDLKPLAELILGAAERGASLVSQLLSFAREKPMSTGPVACAPVLENLVKMLRRTMREDIEISIETIPPQLQCLSDENQLISALLNLCINARDAMPTGGKLSISARGKIDPVGRRLVVIAVTDTGEGMSPDVLERALEPFFTTKPTGKGTGLGLSMVYGFALQCGGSLHISSELGEGTTVELTLPEFIGPVAVSGEMPAAAKPRRARHVLVVEDDPLVRSQVERHLSALGYKATAQDNPRDAMAWLDAHASDVDVVLSDVVMPGGVSAADLASHARALRPELPILLTSGYAEESAVIAQAGEFHFLPKPYRRAELAAALQEALGDG